MQITYNKDTKHAAHQLPQSLPHHITGSQNDEFTLRICNHAEVVGSVPGLSSTCFCLGSPNDKFS